MCSVHHEIADPNPTISDIPKTSKDGVNHSGEPGWKITDNSWWGNVTWEYVPQPVPNPKYTYEWDGSDWKPVPKPSSSPVLPDESLPPLSSYNFIPMTERENRRRLSRSTRRYRYSAYPRRRSLRIARRVTQRGFY